MRIGTYTTYYTHYLHSGNALFLRSDSTTHNAHTKHVKQEQLLHSNNLLFILNY